MADERLTFILEARDLTSGVTRNVRGEISGLGGAVGGLKKQFVTGVAGGNLLATGIQRLTTAIGDSVGEAVEFQTDMLNVNSIVHESEAQFAATSNQVLDLSKTLPQSATTLAKGLYDISSSGFAGADAMKVLTASARAASAGLSTTEVSSAGLTAVLNAYHLSADQATRISDVMFQTVNLGVITFDELAAEIGKTTALSAPLGVSFEEVSAALSLMTRNGIDAANATTQINAIMTNLLKPSRQAVTLANELGIGWDAQALRARGLSGVLADMVEKTKGNEHEMAVLLGNQRAIRGAFVLAADGGAALNAELGKMQDSTGATGKALSEQEKGLAFQMAIAGNKMQALVDKTLLGLAPALIKLVDGLNAAADAVGLFADKMAASFKAASDAGESVARSPFIETIRGWRQTFSEAGEAVGGWQQDVHESLFGARDDARAVAVVTAEAAGAMRQGWVDIQNQTIAAHGRQVAILAGGAGAIEAGARTGIHDPLVRQMALTNEEIKAIAANTPADIANAIISGPADISGVRQRMREIIAHPVSDAKTAAQNAAILISPAVARGLASNSSQVRAQMLAEIVEPTLKSLLTLRPRVFQEGTKLPPELAHAIKTRGPQVVQAMRDLVGQQRAPLAVLAKIAHEQGLAGVEALIRGMIQKKAAARQAAADVAAAAERAMSFNAYSAGVSSAQTFVEGVRASLTSAGNVQYLQKAIQILKINTFGGSLPKSGPLSRGPLLAAAEAVGGGYVEMMGEAISRRVGILQDALAAPTLGAPTVGLAASLDGRRSVAAPAASVVAPSELHLHIHSTVPPTPAQGAALARSVGPELVRWMRQNTG